jgi:hypothetical protein
MKEASEAQILRNLLGPYARVVSAGAPRSMCGGLPFSNLLCNSAKPGYPNRGSTLSWVALTCSRGPSFPAVCHSRVLLGCDAQLRASALLALTKLMVVDPAFCEANLQLLFTLLQSRCAVSDAFHRIECKSLGARPTSTCTSRCCKPGACPYGALCQLKINKSCAG